MDFGIGNPENPMANHRMELGAVLRADFPKKYMHDERNQRQFER